MLNSKKPQGVDPFTVDVNTEYGGIGSTEWGIVKPSFEQLMDKSGVTKTEQSDIIKKIKKLKNKEIPELSTFFYFGFLIEYESPLLKGKKLFYECHLRAVKVCETNEKGENVTELRREVESVSLDTILV